jgi:dihydroorotase
MNLKTLTVAGECVFPSGLHKATITIDTCKGIISSVGPYRSDADISANDLIFPGFIDTHVHGRQDPSDKESYKEDFITLGEAAINGGVCHVAEMGNNPYPPITWSSYADKEDLLIDCPIPVTLYAMAGPDTSPISGRKVPYKFCHARTTGKSDVIFFPNKESIELTARRYTGQETSHHCEDSAIIAEYVDQLTHENRRPPEAEINSVDFAIYLIEKIIGRGNLCHCSVRLGLKKIVEAQERGVEVTYEITPHHLFFDTTMITNENRGFLKMNPPLRSRIDRRFCIEALRGGRGVTLSSDHAPHLEKEKLDPDENKIPSGQPHLDTYGPFVTWLIENESFLPHQILKVCCENPAQWVNKFLPSGSHGYGKIAPGYIGSLTLIDRGTSFTVTKDKLKTKCGWSPFEGFAFPGSVQHTIVKGRVLK